VKTGIGLFFTAIALIFIYRSFYSMRIPEEEVIPLLLGDDALPTDQVVFSTTQSQMPGLAGPKTLVVDASPLKTSQ
jgi:hypothetical protein